MRTREEPTTRTELDSHADTCVAGPNFRFLSGTGETVSVSPFSTELTSLSDVPIGTCATVFDDPNTGQSFLLIVNEAIYLGDRMSHSLLCPNQLRSNGVQVFDVPLQFGGLKHCIDIVEHDLQIPLQLHGTFSYFDSRIPTDNELRHLDRFELTSEVAWEPSSSQFQEMEDDASSRSTSELTSSNRCMADCCCPDLPIELASPELLCSRVLSSVRVVPSDRTASAVQHRRNPPLSKELLARRWGIGINAAERTLTVTTQAGIRKLHNPVERRFHTKQSHLRFPTLLGRFYTDTMFFTRTSIRSHTCAQVITNGLGYTHVYPMKTKSCAPDALTDFIHSSGIPAWIVADNAPELTKGRWRAIIREYHIRQTTTEPYSPWQNRAEGEIRELKRMIRRLAQRTGSPRRLWCFLAELVSNIRKYTATDLPQLRGRVPYELVHGTTPDISEFCQFEWYQWVHYLDHDHERKLGRWLGVAHQVGGAMVSWILPISARPIARSTVTEVTVTDVMYTATLTLQQKEFDDAIKRLIGDKIADRDLTIDVNELFPPIDAMDDLLNDLFVEPDLHESGGTHAPFLPVDDTNSIHGDTMDDVDDLHDSLDEYVNAQVRLPRGEGYEFGTVLRRKRNHNGDAIGTRNPNPILDTRAYEVEFADGSLETYHTNLIAENIYSQVDDEGRSFVLLSEIVDHRKEPTAIAIEDAYITLKSGQRRLKPTTKGWKLEVAWKDGSTSWVLLKDLKESFPIELAEYAMSNKLLDEPAFAWWARTVLRGRNRIVAKVKKYWKRSHKYGIPLPKHVNEALKFDQETGTTFWRDAIAKEMKNVMLAFEFRDDDVMPIGHQKIDCHMIFDVKMDLTRKARMVAGGHQTVISKESTFSSVVSRDSVRIAFTIAALNDIDILACDIQNAYLNAPTKEKVYTIAGREFGTEYEGRPVLIVRALYGLRSSGARFREHVAQSLRDIGFASCLADPDVWLRPATKPDGYEYYEYVLCYVDDLLVLSHNPGDVMKILSTKYKLKDGSIKKPDIYLGADIKEWQIGDADDNGKVRWAMSSETYVKRAVRDVETELAASDRQLPTKVTTPLSSAYRPELDTSAELDGEAQTYYQGLIGILRWICELGRIDILFPVSLMSRYLVCARTGHLNQLFHIFAYLKKHDRSTLVFDDTLPTLDDSVFKSSDWSEYYPEAAEAIPSNAPPPRGAGVSLNCFVDADHAGCQLTRRSHTGVFIFVNRAPVLWFSKRQNTVESSTFGSEFVAMRIAVEMIEGLRYKLRMMGIPIDGATNTFCDNAAVVINSTAPESTLKKKHNAIAYHRVREAVASGTIRIAKEDGETNIADILTKSLPGPRLMMLAQRVLW